MKQNNQKNRKAFLSLFNTRISEAEEKDFAENNSDDTKEPLILEEPIDEEYDQAVEYFKNEGIEFSKTKDREALLKLYDVVQAYSPDYYEAIIYQNFMIMRRLDALEKKITEIQRNAENQAYYADVLKALEESIRKDKEETSTSQRERSEQKQEQEERIPDFAEVLKKAVSFRTDSGMHNYLLKILEKHYAAYTEGEIRDIQKLVNTDPEMARKVIKDYLKPVE